MDCLVNIAALALASKQSLQVDNVFFAVLVTSLGSSPQSSTPCQQTFPCCTAHLVWLVLGARETSYMGGGVSAQSISLRHIFCASKVMEFLMKIEGFWALFLKGLY